MTNDNFLEIIQNKTDTELREIFLNKESYDPEFGILAEQELLKRQIDITDLSGIREHNKQVRTAQLEQGKAGSATYLIICFILSLLGGVAGIIGGYIYAFSTVKDEDGNKYYDVYEAKTRDRGKAIFFIGIAVFIIAIITRL